MRKKQYLVFCGIFALYAVYGISPVFAGFEWVAPDSGSYASMPSSGPVVVSGAPVATSAPEVISPVIITGDGSSANSMQRSAVMQQPVATVVTPISSAPAVVYPTQTLDQHPSLATATIAVASSPNTVVQGFASQIPLPLALRQILPTGYNFSIDQDIDMETLVSYKGGKNWRETLGDMLAAANLSAHEQGNTITVSRTTNVQAVPVAGPAPVSVATVQNTTPISVAHAVATDISVSHVAEMPSVNVGSPDGWSAQRGDSLRQVLTQWCARGGVELQWLAEYDYPLEASATFNGDFEDAVRSLLAGFETARPQPYAELHANANASQKILVVQTRGNSYSN